MQAARTHERPTYSRRLLQPFAEVLQGYGVAEDALRGLVDSAGERVLVEIANRALDAMVEYTKDPDLGLKAARRLVHGDAGGVDYVMSSAPTVKKAIEEVRRYTRLINDVLDIRLRIDGQIATVVLDNRTALPRAAMDFEVAGFFGNHVKQWMEDRLSELTVWFTHPAPPSCGEYELTFAPARVRFNAPMLGFSFDRRLLDLPLRGADPNLHRVMVPYANDTLNRLPATRSVAAEVRTLLSSEHAAGNLDVADAARRNGMSVRTLSRKLAKEGTTFRALADDARRALALAAVGDSDLAFSEIAYRLGFSHTAAFHRAFRRWTGETPRRYRRAWRR